MRQLVNSAAGRIPVLCGLIIAAGTAHSQTLHICVPPEDWHMLPPEYLEALEAPARVAKGGTLTPVFIDIDPLGAPPNVPWTCHLTTLNVRTEPTVNGSSVVGSISQNDQYVMGYYVVQESDEEWLQFEFEGEQRWASRLGLYRPHPTNVDSILANGNLPYGTEIINRWWGIPLSYEPDDLQTVPTAYAVGSGRQLRAEALAAVIEMIDAARADGINFLVSSPYRSGPTQQTIYVNNTQNNLSQRFSAPPGHSEHQLGATIDFTDPSDGNFLENTDPQHGWLEQNGARFGYRQTYTADNIEATGYVEEPWHWRYVGRQNLLTAEQWMIY